MKYFILLAAMAVLCPCAFSQIPVISSFTPATGPIGTQVTISGTNFNPAATGNIVYFGAVKAVVQSASTTSLTVTVPYGATFHPLSVAVNNYVAQAARPFIVTYAGGGMDFTSSSFASPATLAGDAYASAADIDGDQRTDLIYAGSTTNKITIYRNTTAGGPFSFASTELSGFTVPTCIKAGDLNGDGLLDLVVSSSTQFKLYVLLNTSTPGNISFNSPLVLNTITEPRKIAIGDIDKDGKADIACTRASVTSVSVFRNTTAGSGLSFAAMLDFTLTGSSEGLAIGDLTEDGKPEIITAVIGARGISVLENTSTPGVISFNARVHFFTDGAPWEVAIADIDGDGRADMMSTNTTSNNITVYRHATSNPLTFDAKINLPTATDPRGMELGDLNADGKPDLVTSHSSSDSAISVLKNMSTPGNIAFKPFVEYGSSPGFGSVSLADLNNDGLTDITIGKLQSSALSIFKNLLNFSTCPTVPNSNTITAMGNTTICSTDSVQITTNATSNIQWFLNNLPIVGATGTSIQAKQEGAYTVRIVNGSCYSDPTNSIMVTIKAIPAAPAITGASGFCTGDSLLLHASSAVSIKWYNNHVAIPGATSQDYYVKDAGIYTVTTTQTGCTSAESNSLSPTVFSLPAKPIITSGGTSLSTTAGFASYVWYRDNIIISGATTNQYNTTQNGIYKVTISDINGCKNTSDNFNYITTGLNEVVLQGYTIQVYPNPVINELNVQVEQTLGVNGIINMVLMDITGKQIQSQLLKQGSNTVYCNKLPPGVYMVVLKNGNAEKTIKILKRN